jgi:predicted nucleic acid-binding protein
VAEARRLLQQGRTFESYLIAPAILAYELPNGLLNATRKDRVSLERMKVCLKEFVGLPVTMFLNDPEATFQTMNLAAARQLTFYDASYLTMAIGRDAVLATGDADLIAAAEAKGARVLPIGI